MSNLNTNPFIGDKPTESLTRVSQGLIFLQDIEILRTVAADTDHEGEVNLSASGSYGYHLLVDAIRYAVEYESAKLSPLKEVPNV